MQAQFVSLLSKCTAGGKGLAFLVEMALHQGMFGGCEYYSPKYFKKSEIRYAIPARYGIPVISNGALKDKSVSNGKCIVEWSMYPT